MFFSYQLQNRTQSRMNNNNNNKRSTTGLSTSRMSNKVSFISTIPSAFVEDGGGVGDGDGRRSCSPDRFVYRILFHVLHRGRCSSRIDRLSFSEEEKNSEFSVI